MIGWNSRAGRIVKSLKECSRVTAALHPRLVGLVDVDTNIDVRSCDPSDLDSLVELGLECFRHVVVLLPEDVASDRADDEVLLTLIHLRQLQSNLARPFTIVAEMSDDANRVLAQIAQPDDIIVRDKVVTLLMIQIALNPALEDVVAALFGSAESRIRVKAAAPYLNAAGSRSFDSIVAVASEWDESVIGYRRRTSGDGSQPFEVILNPANRQSTRLTESDQVVLIGPDS